MCFSGGLECVFDLLQVRFPGEGSGEGIWSVFGVFGGVIRSGFDQFRGKCQAAVGAFFDQFSATSTGL